MSPTSAPTPAPAASAHAGRLPVRPLLKPALQPVWRERDVLQLGLTGPHAVVLHGIGAPERDVLALLDGTRTADEVIAAGRAATGDELVARRLLRALLDAGALDDAAAPGPAVDEHDRQRLEPDALSLSLRHPRPGAAAAALAARAAATVAVHGCGRVGATLAGLLAAAGVGQVRCVDDAAVRIADLAPGGVRTVVAGSRAVATAAALAADARGPEPHRAAVDAVAADAAADGPPADLAVVAPTGPVVVPEVARAVRDVPHLVAAVRETRAVVGPLVVPGRTPCLRCLELARADRDPDWPVLAAQLVSRHRALVAVDAALAALAASLAALQVLDWLDAAATGAALPASAGAVLEFDLGGATLRRRRIDAHPSCGCGAAG